MIRVLDIQNDEVIDSIAASSITTYGYALENFYPLVDRFTAQRKVQEQKFYKRLKRDILKGCLMPAITVAFVGESINSQTSKEDVQNFINDNVSKGYVLDGLQRLTTLMSASEENEFNSQKALYVNVIISPSEDKLLYRMITLNNGQRPMTPRHQIEILTKEMFDFNELNISVQTEKERSEQPVRGSYDLADISKGYLAFLTKTVNNDNNKIIDEKMDQILVGRILDTDIKSAQVQFRQVMDLVDRFSESTNIKKWFQVNNNFIGFCVGIHDAYDVINQTNNDDFERALELFEVGFSSIKTSKVNLGKYRRMLSMDFIRNYSSLAAMDGDEISEYFMELTVS